MPDYRQTRSLQPGEVEPGPITSLYIPYLNDPTYTTPEKIAGPGLGGAGNESATPQTALAPDDRLANIQALGDQRTQLENQLAANRQAQDAGGMSLGGLWDGLKQVGSSIGDGLSAMMPSGDTLRSGAMRLAQGLEAGGATMQGRTPLYIQQALADREFGLKQQEFNEKRMQLAQQLQQQRQQQQEKDEEQVLGIWKSNLPLSQKKKMSDFFAAKGVALAGNLSRLGNEDLVGKLDILGKYLPEGKVEELTNIMRQPNADLSQVEPWINFAEEKHKTFGQETMKNERLMDLVKRRQAGELPETHPDFLELDKGLDELRQRRQKAAETDLKIEQLGLGNQKAKLENAIASQMPQTSAEIPQPGGNTGKYVVYPDTMQKQFVTGTKPPAFEKANDIEVAKAVGKDFAAIQDGGMKAQARINKLDRMEQLIKGIETGTLRPALAETYNIAESFGIHLDPRLGDQQAFEALSNELALNARNTAEGGGMPGAMSDADRKYLKNTVPGLSQSPEGNQKLIDIHRKIAKREVEIAKESREYLRKNKGLDVGLYDHLQQYAESHPLFPQEKESGPPKITSEEEYKKLPSGTEYIDPNGKHKRKR